MSGVDQLQYLSWLLYLLGFVLVLRRTLMRPTRAHVDMTLFFGAVTLVVLMTVLGRLGWPLPAWLTRNIAAAGLLSVGYLLLRLVADFSYLPSILLRAVEIGMLSSILAVIVVPPPVPLPLSLGIVSYLVLVIAFDAWSFTREAGRTQGVTRRRMQAAAVASACVVVVLVGAGVAAALPSQADAWVEFSAILGLASGIGYFIAFAPPTWLRRAWQEPELRAFLGRAVHLAGVADNDQIVAELERTAADAFGAPAARIAVWDRDLRRLVVDGAPLPDALARAWTQQRPNLIQHDLARLDTTAFHFEGAQAALSAPIGTHARRIGVLFVFATRSPVFANSDLELIQLLADQTAVILEARALTDQSAQVRAREEATRLKDDFLSSAAHDLKTPLTAIVTQAQVMRRRAQRNPGAPTDLVGLDRLLEQSHRLKTLVLELLDVSRLEDGSLVGEREEVDLAEIARTLAAQERERWARVQLDAEPRVMALVDPPRFEQVLTNLVENALKYSPLQTPVQVRLWREAGEARLSVHDEGIGIPVDDQALVFERFHRARNVDDRRFAGMGLGLYIARGIVEQHAGRIWVESTPGQGSTFHVAVPEAVPAVTLAAPEQPSVVSP